MKSSTVQAIAIAVLPIGLVFGIILGFATHVSTIREPIGFNTAYAISTWVSSGVIFFKLYLWCGLLKNQEKQIANQEILITLEQQKQHPDIGLPYNANSQEPIEIFVCHCKECGNGIRPSEVYCAKCGNHINGEIVAIKK